MPIAGVGAVVISKNSNGETCVLIVRRGREPMRGQWSLPGGVLELGETLAEGVQREIKEETGLEVEVLDHIETFDRIVRDEGGRVRYHYIISDWLCVVRGGNLCCGDDAEEAVWLSRAEMASNNVYPLDEFVLQVISKAFAIYAKKDFAKEL